MSAAPPPDLRVLCRKLTVTPPEQLPFLLPTLTRHVARSKDTLSAPTEARPKYDASQASMLVAKLKTNISMLLNGRRPEARLAAVALVDAVVDAGGWEMLRCSEPWVRGLLSILQKGDTLAVKSFAVLTLTRIYTKIQPYQTLVREIATPTIPTFISACLQLMKPGDESYVVTSSALPCVETVATAFGTLIPLHPTTFRPFSSQIRASIRGYLAPTSCDRLIVPHSLQRAAGRLLLSLHHVAAKSAHHEEWQRIVESIFEELHATADKVLRAVQESWQPSSGNRPKPNLDDQPQGGSLSSDYYPPWSGLSDGADRLIGLFHLLSDSICCQTKGAVAIPLSQFMDAVARVCLIARLSPKLQSWEQVVETNPAISREEREELWSVMPDIHVAAMQLVFTMLRRLGAEMLPLVSEILDPHVRVFRSAIGIASMRKVGYLVLEKLLHLAGPTMSKQTVNMLDYLIAGCCRDLQEDAGVLKAAPKATTTSTDAKKNGSMNADLFLQPQASASKPSPHLDADHKIAAERLLRALLSLLPQQHLKPSLRGLLDKTAILNNDREAMLASVLNPYRDQRGRMYASILPFLSRQYPDDQTVEILRGNMRTIPVAESTVAEASLSFTSMNDIEKEIEHGDDIEEGKADGPFEAEHAPEGDLLDLKPIASLGGLAEESTAEKNPFKPKSAEPSWSVSFKVSPSESTNEETQPKRKCAEAEPLPSKRQELEVVVSGIEASVEQAAEPAAERSEQEDDSDESVHLNMVLEDDEDEDDEVDEQPASMGT